MKKKCKSDVVGDNDLFSKLAQKWEIPVVEDKQTDE